LTTSPDRFAWSGRQDDGSGKIERAQGAGCRGGFTSAHRREAAQGLYYIDQGNTSTSIVSHQFFLSDKFIKMALSITVPKEYGLAKSKCFRAGSQTDHTQLCPHNNRCHLLRTSRGLPTPRARTDSHYQVGFWHGSRVSMFRKPAGIPYPKHYAESADFSAASPEQKKKMYLYNCAQRAHGM
jgi:hypothetical protein